MNKLILSILIILSVNIFAKEIQIKSADGFVLKGWLKFPKTIASKYPIAFFAHEFGSSHKMWKDISFTLRNCGYATLEVDLRGHGKSILQDGKKNAILNDLTANHFLRSIKISAKNVNFKNIPDDISLWLEKLSENEKLDMENLAMFGASLGGGAIISTFLEFEPKTVVLFSPTSPKYFDKEAINESISNSEAKILIFSSQGDFALKNALYYAKKALTPTLIIVPGSGHGSATFELAMPYLKTYLHKYLKQSTCKK